ncbi:DUF1707 domain-containing protein [Streptomonospora sp. PA3]|uniref:DUF1707 SHOCT-like domain-containing protein n=1 Tax=Streptomonospora sp. PA3 TaxID=2607326 RepID=UPI0012DCB05C|nr:DUF1707 domain-containing protein [Streptomonospora sp. PA3]MUL42445.1 DUF1707 domain-containing protein [Streptomonospora sp. PA3]
MNETVSAAPAAHDTLRASDADRDRVAELLAAALSEGRLSHDEHSERIDAAYAARTLGELAPLTADLPGAPARPHADRTDLAPSPDGTENIRAVLAAAERTGRWLVEPRTNVSVVLGSAVLDMRSAVLSQREVTVQVALLLGSLQLIVPPGVRVVSRVAEILGSTTLDTGTDVDPAAPTVVIAGASWLSAVSVETKQAKTAKRKHGCR